LTVHANTRRPRARQPPEARAQRADQRRLEEAEVHVGVLLVGGEEFVGVEEGEGDEEEGVVREVLARAGEVVFLLVGLDGWVGGGT
jgi:hypothetical protein